MKLNKIRISGTTYDVGGSNVIELTQAEYDALVDIDPTVFYIITDATEVDINDYYKKSETSGKTEISTALNGKQDTLVSGTNIKTVNNESILGSGNIDIQSGKELVGGTNISVSTGTTADTINCTLPITGNGDTVLMGYQIQNDYSRNNIVISTQGSTSIEKSKIYAKQSISIGANTTLSGSNMCELSIALGNSTNIYGVQSTALGVGCSVSGNTSVAIGRYSSVSGNSSVAIGNFASVSGNSSVAIGSGATADGVDYKTNINNQIKITPTNQIYVYDSTNTELLRLQDYMRRKPVVLYETDGTTGLLGLNESSYGTDNYQLTDMDFTPYKYLKCYIKPSVDTLADSAKSPAVVVEVPLDDAASSGSYFMGAQEVIYPFNRNRHFACGVAVDPTKTKLKFVYEVTLWDVSTSAANAAADGRYLYKIVGYYD